jgi:hypothetical protein
MSNSYGAHVWVIDTASATTIWSDRILIRRMIWNPSAANQSLIVKDANGKTIWEAPTSLDGGSIGAQEIDFGSGKWFDGLAVTTLTGGKLFVYIN